MAALDRAREVVPRRALGAYYTPTDIAETLTRWALRANLGPVLDPSYGVCRFLVAAVEVLAEGGVENPACAVHGIDIDADATAATTRTLLRRGARRGQFISDDFFGVEPDARFAAVLGNPPYVRHHWQNPDVKAAAGRAMHEAGVSLSRRASLWAPFVVHADRFVRPGGRLAMLLPGAAVQAGYVDAVWKHLAQRYAYVTLVRVGERAFADALEETVVVLADRREDRGGHTPLVVEVSTFSALSLALAEDPSVVQLRKRGRRRERARSTLTTRRLLAIATEHDASRQLGDVAEIRIGTVTGANAFFVRSARDELISRLKEDEIDHVVPGSRSMHGAFWTETDDADAADAGQRCRMLRLNPERRLRGNLASTIIEAKDARIHKGYHCRRRDPWWAIEPGCPPDAFLAYMAGTVKGIVCNDIAAGCINGVHRVTWLVPDGEAYVLSTWTSLWAMVVEQSARHYAGGVLKLEPGAAPELPVVRHDDPEALVVLDAVLRDEGMNAARRLADRLVLQEVLGFSREQVTTLQASVVALMARRSPRIRSSA